MKAWLGWFRFSVCLFALFDCNKHKVCIGWLHSCWPLKLTRCWLAGASNWWMMLTKWAEQLNFTTLQHRVLVPVFTVGRGKGQDEDTAIHLQQPVSLLLLLLHLLLLPSVCWIASTDTDPDNKVCLVWGFFFPHYDDFKTILNRQHTFLLWFIVGNWVRILQSVIERKTLRLVFLPGIHYQNRKRTSALWLQSQDIRGEWKGA